MVTGQGQSELDSYNMYKSGMIELSYFIRGRVVFCHHLMQFPLFIIMCNPLDEIDEDMKVLLLASSK